MSSSLPGTPKSQLDIDNHDSYKPPPEQDRDNQKNIVVDDRINAENTVELLYQTKQDPDGAVASDIVEDGDKNESPMVECEYITFSTEVQQPILQQIAPMLPRNACRPDDINTSISAVTTTLSIADDRQQVITSTNANNDSATKNIDEYLDKLNNKDNMIRSTSTRSLSTVFYSVRNLNCGNIDSDGNVNKPGSGSLLMNDSISTHSSRSKYWWSAPFCPAAANSGSSDDSKKALLTEKVVHGGVNTNLLCGTGTRNNTISPAKDPNTGKNTTTMDEGDTTTSGGCGTAYIMFNDDIWNEFNNNSIPTGENNNDVVDTTSIDGNGVIEEHTRSGFPRFRWHGSRFRTRNTDSPTTIATTISNVSGTPKDPTDTNENGAAATSPNINKRQETAVDKDKIGSSPWYLPNCCFHYYNNNNNFDTGCTRKRFYYWLHRSPFILVALKILAVLALMVLVHVQTKRSVESSIQRPQSFCTPLQMALSSSQDNDIAGSSSSSSSSTTTNKKKNPFVVTNMYNGIVASDQAICSQLGLSILQDLGGNAIDAAVTTALCLGVVNPASSGLGGGAFMLIQADPSKMDNDDNVESNSTDMYTDARVRHYWSGQPISYTTTNGKVVEVIDAREVAPAAAYTEMFSENGNDQADTSVYGGLSIAVPGELRGLEVAHLRHGSIPWEQLIEPVISLATNGIDVSKYLANVINNITYKVNTGSIPYNDTWRLRQYITKQNDWANPLKEGDVIHNTNLLRTLVKIRDYGADGLYAGVNGELLASDIQSAGGIVTADDIQNYRPIIRTPVAGSANGFTIVGVPPPSSGGAVIIGALRFLSYFSIPLASFTETLSAHRIVEAMKHVFSIRMSLCDPAFSTSGEDGDDDSVEQAVYDLIAGDYMQSLRTSYYSDNTTMPLYLYGGSKYSKINSSDYVEYSMAADAHEGDRKLQHKQQEESHQRKLYRTDGHLNDGGTSHISIVDKFGNAVSLTTSINTVYGSLVVSPTTGIVLANTMDDFSNPTVVNDYSTSTTDNYFGIPPSEANYIQPGKKPLSSMSPTFVYKENEDAIVSSANDNSNSNVQQSQIDVGDLYLVVGGSGGPKIITSVLQVIVNYLFMGRSLLKSVIQPRLHNQLLYHGTATTTFEKSVVNVDVVDDEYFDSSASKALHHSFDLFPFYKRKDSGHEEAILLEVPSRTISALTRRNHYLTNIDYTGTVQAIAIDPETSAFVGVSDIRKHGSPAGY